LTWNALSSDLRAWAEVTVRVSDILLPLLNETD